MTVLPCYKCGDSVSISLDIEAEVTLCEACTLEYYVSLEEVFV